MRKLIAPWSALVICGFVLALLAPASAQVLDQYDSQLTGGLGDFTLVSTVSQNGDLYRYQYELSYYDAYLNRPLTGFSIGNTLQLLYENAGYSVPDGVFINPAYSSIQDSIQWNASTPMSEDKVATFYYDSPHPWKVVDVTAYGGSYIASGKTLGLNVPEPGAIATLGLGALGVGSALLRRRRSR